MGGNALPGIPTRRLNAEEFHRVARSVTFALTERFGARAEAIPAYRTKADFGDLDVVVEKEKVLAEGDGHAWLRDFAKAHGHARAFKANGNVLSYDHRADPSGEDGFQVDLILTPAAEFDAALAYFSYNDLGNLIGRTAHKMGFVYGHRGLLYPFRDGTHLFRTLDVCLDTDRALEFLGYDPRRFRRGFEDLPDIFDYVTGSRYFNPALFLLENRNHTDRVRDRKRKTYSAFLQHLEQHPELSAFAYPADKAEWLPRAIQAFPAFGVALEDTRRELEDSRFVRSVFNGDRVSGWTGIQGRELGHLMSAVREGFPSKDAWVAFLRSADEATLRDRVMGHLPAARPAVARPLARP